MTDTHYTALVAAHRRLARCNVAVRSAGCLRCRVRAWQWRGAALARVKALEVR